MLGRAEGVGSGFVLNRALGADEFGFLEILECVDDKAERDHLVT